MAPLMRCTLPMTPVYHIQLIQPLSIGSATFLRETRLSNDNGKQDLPDHGLGEIARHFVGARQQGRSLPDFPGTIPADLVTAYQVQDQAIALWGDQVVGWKVGYIAARQHPGQIPRPRQPRHPHQDRPAADACLCDLIDSQLFGSEE